MEQSPTPTLKNPNHPKKGSIIRVEPIRTKAAIDQIRANLATKPRNRCLFDFGINTAFRANELLSLQVGQVQHLVADDLLTIRQSKTGQTRTVLINQTVVIAVQEWLAIHPNPAPDAPLFLSGRGSDALTVPAVWLLVNDWCVEIELPGNYGSHTMRKTWGFHQYHYNNADLPRLMKAFGHATQEQTLEYLCIEDMEVLELFKYEL